jgi:hypothetical protein
VAEGEQQKKQQQQQQQQQQINPSSQQVQLTDFIVGR